MKQGHQNVKELAGAFIQKYAPATLPFEERILNVLDARGFLIDFDGVKPIVSNNSFVNSHMSRTDGDFLNFLLNKYGLGSVYREKSFSTRLLKEYILLENPASEEILIAIFLEYLGCGSVGYSGCDWKTFKRRRHGRKIPVEYLDPFIAKLIKSLSAIGIFTGYSCDGHGQGEAVFSLSDKHNIAWFMVIKDILCKRFQLKSEWKIEDIFVKVVNEDVNELIWEMQIVADALYRSRVDFRELRKNCIQKLSKSDVIGLDANKLYILFKGRADQYLKSNSELLSEFFLRSE